MNRLAFVSTFCLIFFIGVGCGKWLSASALTPVGFWDVKFIQLFDISVGIAIAVCVTAIISRQLNYGLKQRELVTGCITDYETMLGRVYDAFTTYARAPSKESAQEALRLHKCASNSLSVMVSILKASSKCSDGNLFVCHETNYLKFKTAMTDSPFGTDKKPITDCARLDKVDSSFCASRKALVETKLALYNSRPTNGCWLS